ncbi:hypothetical protein GCM10009530_62040 [Microbispora corallina]|uniref:Uncharacterized protein n=1 Tax=Microbispora corallina TaxID=83302 RepID=A0ABQ4G7W2_9ACTN|nr:hypothetical protein [Microbispora corallina]GIH43155.1 hypothetical protein Mco01_61550 [Microbispora corallina]
MELGHAEVEQVWPRGGRVRLTGFIAGAEAGSAPETATLTLTDRDHPTVVLTCPATLRGGRFETSFGIDLLASASPLEGDDGRQVWDLHLKVPGRSEPLRLGRHLDDIPNKKKVITFPAQTDDTPMGPISVKPYYTVQSNLSLICRRG